MKKSLKKILKKDYNPYFFSHKEAFLAFLKYKSLENPCYKALNRIKPFKKIKYLKNQAFLAKKAFKILRRRAYE